MQLDPAPFRDKLRSAGFYTEWKGKYGEEAWAILEKVGRQTGVKPWHGVSGRRRSSVRARPRASPRGVTGLVDAWLGAAVEITAAVLVAAEIVDPVQPAWWRATCFDAPLMWSDELASMLFLWLAMLGAVDRFSPRRAYADDSRRWHAAGRRARALLDTFATGAALAFLLLIAWPAYDYALEQVPILTPALQIYRCRARRRAACRHPVDGDLRCVAARQQRVAARSCRRARRRRRLRRCCSGSASRCFSWLGNLNLLIFFVGVVAATRIRRRADRLRFRLGDLRLSGADHANAADGAGRPHGRGHEPSHPACRAAVRLPRPADRNDGHGARHGRVPGEPAGPRARRPAIRARRRRCIWFRASRARKPRIWRRSRRCCFPK